MLNLQADYDDEADSGKRAEILRKIAEYENEISMLKIQIDKGRIALGAPLTLTFFID